MQKGKVLSLEKIPIAVWKILKEIGLIYLAIFSEIKKTRNMPSDWIVIPTHKNKGDLQNCTFIRLNL